MTNFTGTFRGDAVPSLSSRPAAEVYTNHDVLYRGYIANVDALIREAKKRGEAPVDLADGELFARAYQWWGRNLQTHVLGEFAVCVFDRKNARLLLTHDALGLVPLFYLQGPDGLKFASHLDDLAGLSGVRELDEEYIADYITTANVISTRTPYVNVHRLAPGHSLYWENGKSVVCRTWDITRIQAITLDSDEEYEAHFRSLLRQGVQAALRCKRKAWSELSGGLDSSSVVSMAAHSNPGRLEAISIVHSASKSADESAWMKVVVGEFSLPWHRLDGDETRPFSELPRQFCAEPLNALPNSGLFRRYNALAKSHDVGVILSGHGGDQVFCGGSPRPYFLADLLPLRPGRFFRELHDWQTHDPARRSLLYHCLNNVLRPSFHYWTRRSLFSPAATVPPPWVRPDYSRTMSLQDRAAVQTAPRCRSIGQQYSLELIWRSGFPAGDDSTQVFAYRYPLFYRPLVEFMLAIPWEQKLQPYQDRYLQRRALRGILPEPIRQRRNKGEPAEAEIEGLRNASPWTDLLLDNPRVVERGYVDPVLWHEAVNQAKFGRIGSMRHFLATATTEIWLRQLDASQHSTVHADANSCPDSDHALASNTSS